MNRADYEIIERKFKLPPVNDFFAGSLAEAIQTLKRAGFVFTMNTKPGGRTLADIDVNISARHPEVDWALRFKTLTITNRSGGVGGESSKIWQQSPEFRELKELEAACA